MMPQGPESAHTRSTDPDTSYLAADAVTPDLRELQQRVEAYSRRKGRRGFTDAEMSHDLADEGSTMRTRRAELAARNLILDSGARRRWGDSPRSRIVWLHREFVANPPPIVDPVAPASAADRAEARALAESLSRMAAGMMRQGLAAASAEIERGARMLARLSR